MDDGDPDCGGAFRDHRQPFPVGEKRALGVGRIEVRLLCGKPRLPCNTRPALAFEETLFANTAGHLCEAATSNVFLVKNGALHTPSLGSGCLPGITRAVVIELAATLGIPCEERDFPVDELHAADELFLTSSIRGVMAVSRFEDRVLPAGPGHPHASPGMGCRHRPERTTAGSNVFALMRKRIFRNLIALQT